MQIVLRFNGIETGAGMPGQAGHPGTIQKLLQNVFFMFTFATEYVERFVCLQPLEKMLKLSRKA